MKWFSFSLLLAVISMFALLEAAPSGQIRVRTQVTQRVHVRNGNIKWNGDCHNCNIRTTKNTAEVTSTRRREYVRRF
ncbi:uncharacterized protein LOC133843679 [Drosophila sulfurigaster albostrigata]|uniref:uncharacterized protein LOC133843679 n=1 Tax=Drosophila sulfurigaster albostrigata TaxID=89887 RepID=UPI002D2183C9|nr:uncharacterized protein LOC133843679 [Drosophila sulfurigaster albostrigata]